MRQVGADLGDLAFNDIEVINQPFSGRRDGLTIDERIGDIAPDKGQGGFIVGEALG